MIGKTIAVTGAAGRLGRELVATLDRRGFNVAAFVMNDAEARLIPPGSNGRIEAFRVDVTDPESVASAFQDAGERFSGLHGLVHTVGAWGMTPLLETSLEDWNRLVNLNLTSAFLCFREATRLLAASGGGAMVAIASGQGADRGASGQAAYSAAKAGVVRLVEAAADELAPLGITCHAVAPSTILFDGASGPGVPVATVVDACLSGFGERPPASGSILRVY